MTRRLRFETFNPPRSRVHLGARAAVTTIHALATLDAELITASIAPIFREQFGVDWPGSIVAYPETDELCFEIAIGGKSLDPNYLVGVLGLQPNYEEMFTGIVDAGLAAATEAQAKRDEDEYGETLRAKIAPMMAARVIQSLPVEMLREAISDCTSTLFGDDGPVTVPERLTQFRDQVALALARAAALDPYTFLINTLSSATIGGMIEQSVIRDQQIAQSIAGESKATVDADEPGEPEADEPESDGPSDDTGNTSIDDGPCLACDGEGCAECYGTGYDHGGEAPTSQESSTSTPPAAPPEASRQTDITDVIGDAVVEEVVDAADSDEPGDVSVDEPDDIDSTATPEAADITNPSPAKTQSTEGEPAADPTTAESVADAPADGPTGADGMPAFFDSLGVTARRVLTLLKTSGEMIGVDAIAARLDIDKRRDLHPAMQEITAQCRAAGVTPPWKFDFRDGGAYGWKD